MEGGADDISGKFGDALGESEERFKLLSEVTFEAIVVHGADRIITANRAFADLFGVEQSEIEGESLSDFFEPGSRERLLDNVSGGVEHPFAVTAGRKDGSIFPAQLRSREVPYHGSVISVTAIRDLTEQYRAEDAMRRVERRLEQLIEGLPIAVLLMDREGRPAYANRMAEEMLGMGVRGIGPEVRAGRMSEVFEMYVAGTDVFYPDLSKPVYLALEGRSVTVDDMEIKRPEGRIRIELSAAPIFDDEGDVSFAILVFKDITARKKAEEALRRAEEKYRTIFEKAVEGIFQSTPDGRFVTVNAKMASIWGYSSPQEMIAGVADVASLYVEPGRRKDFMRLMEEHGSVQGFVARMYRMDGSVVEVAIDARAVKDRRGSIMYYEGFVVDARERIEEG